MNFFSISPLGARCAAAAAAMFLGACAGLRAAELRHDFYVGVSLSKSLIMGGKVEEQNGLYVLEGRTKPRHLGYNHPKVDSVAAGPRNPSVLYVAGLNGVLRSPDAGRTWRIMTGWDMTEPKDLALDPGRPDDVYIGLPDGIAVSRDAGKTWKRCQEGIRRAFTGSILVDRTKVGRVLAGTELGIYLSDDGAGTWKRVLETRKTVLDLVQSPHDARRLLAVTQADGAFLSSDGGLSWKLLQGTAGQGTLHNGDFDPAASHRLVLCGWQCGVLVSSDDGATWTARNQGLPNTHVWRVAVDPDLPRRLYAAPHQQPLQVSEDGGETWKPLCFGAATVWTFAFLPRP